MQKREPSLWLTRVIFTMVAMKPIIDVEIRSEHYGSKLLKLLFIILTNSICTQLIMSVCRQEDYRIVLIKYKK